MNKSTQQAIQIIAEVGINHDGSFDIARQLIQAAADASVHGVKFQYRNIMQSYTANANEIGDEILQAQIKRCYLSPEKLVLLCEFAHDLGIQCGISFFIPSDMLDFAEDIKLFDFFKVPSAELLNNDLIDSFINTGKFVYVSTGCHQEEEIEQALSRLPSSGWMPLHCISNYPAMQQNARLGYLSYLQKKWNTDVGYSSHDDSWEVCLLALQLGAKIIERHITLNKLADGLDHSSSSTPDEFKKLAEFATNFDLLTSGDAPRVANQGEMLNRQNLGRSFYAIKDLTEGHLLSMDDVVYRSPNVGLGQRQMQSYIGKPLTQNVPRWSPITAGVFMSNQELPENVLQFARKHCLALPVRLHDYHDMQKQFPIGAFEFHLSYKEVNQVIDVEQFDKGNRYSVHLPDYVSSTLLIDPFSLDEEQRQLSLDVLEKTVQFAENLQQHSKKLVVVVGSFSAVHEDLNHFHQQHAELLNSYQDRSVSVSIQWLPPIAWYFGGSIRLDVMNSHKDVDLLKRYQTFVCMDVCHLIMCRNATGFSAHQLIDELSANINHVHIADAAGIDGEGLAIGDGEVENIELIKRCLDFDCMKVIEVWQGHLDNGAGFYKALLAMSQLLDD